jgi:hypothetical protein
MHYSLHYSRQIDGTPQVNHRFLAQVEQFSARLGYADLGTHLVVAQAKFNQRLSTELSKAPVELLCHNVIVDVPGVSKAKDSESLVH